MSDPAPEDEDTIDRLIREVHDSAVRWKSRKLLRVIDKINREYNPDGTKIDPEPPEAA